MACIAPGIPRHIVQRGDRRHGSGNEHGVPGIPGGNRWHDNGDECGVCGLPWGNRRWRGIRSRGKGSAQGVEANVSNGKEPPKVPGGGLRAFIISGNSMSVVNAGRLSACYRTSNARSVARRPMWITRSAATAAWKSRSLSPNRQRRRCGHCEPFMAADESRAWNR